MHIMRTKLTPCTYRKGFTNGQFSIDRNTGAAGKTMPFVKAVADPGVRVFIAG